MTPRERILALRLLEKQEQNPDYARRIGIQVHIVKQDPEIKADHTEEKNTHFILKINRKML